MPGEELPRAIEEGRRTGAPLVRQDFRISQARGIVDGDVDEFIPDSRSVATAIAVDAMTDHADLGQWLDVEVDELGSMLPLVTHGRQLRGLEQRQSRQADTASTAATVERGMRKICAICQPVSRL
jgi:hypothetical protein